MNSIKKYSRKHIGETYMTNENLGEYICKIIDGGSKENFCTVLINSWTGEVRFSNLKRGKIKYPYFKSLYGVGFIGEGKYKTKIDGKTTLQYQVWKNMITRCYSKKYQENQPTYKGVEVCKEWHNYQIFSEWFDENYIDGFCLDKDLLSKEKKIYSPLTCIFIPSSLNNFIANNRRTNTSGCTGVYFVKSIKKWKASIKIGENQKLLGHFDSMKSASTAYKTARAALANEWRESMSSFLPEYALRNIS